MKTGEGIYLTHVLKALSLNNVTSPGRIAFIISRRLGLFNIRGLTFGHELCLNIANLSSRMR
jgi:hypothetical protein